VINIIKEKLKEKASQKGVIFDGFPRTIQTLPTHLVINIVLNESILLEKSLARRTCVSCGKSYNSSIHRDGYEMDPFTATLRKMGSVISVAINWWSEKMTMRLWLRREWWNMRRRPAPILEIYKKKKIVFEFASKRGVKDYDKFLGSVNHWLRKF